MTDRALDELARRVLLDAARQEYSGFIKEPPGHDFAPAFEKKMKKLLRRAKHPDLYRFVQAVACLLLVVLLTGCAVLAVSQEAREVFAGWVREVYETNFVYRYNGPEKEGVADTSYLPTTIVYRPTWIPEGYTYEEELLLPGQVVVDYRSENGVFTLFYIQDPQKDKSVYVNPEGAEGFQVKVKGKPAEVYVHDVAAEMNIILWGDDSGALFIIHGTLTKDELIRVAESVGPTAGDTSA